MPPRWKQGTTVDVHDVLEHDTTVQRIHAQAEVFDPPTEHAFKFMQVRPGQVHVHRTPAPAPSVFLLTGTCAHTM